MTGGVAPPAAYALPGPGADPCIPDPTTTANDAELLGTLRLVDAAVVGLDSRISLDGAKLRLHDLAHESRSIGQGKAGTYRLQSAAHDEDGKVGRKGRADRHHSRSGADAVAELDAGETTAADDEQARRSRLLLRDEWSCL